MHDDATRPAPRGDEQPGRRLWIDASAGVAGDMLLGALVDAGASLETIQAGVDAVIPGAVRLTQTEVERAGMRATKVDVTSLVPDPPHRHWTEIRRLLSQARLPGAATRRATAVFARIAEAEARAHGVDVEQVHFHEVGAWDSIADVVGVCVALEALGVHTITAGPVALGSGTVRAAHGEMPVPVPAVLELARGWQVRAGGQGELATPTGMALVVALAEACEPLPDLVPAAVGVGAGTRDVPERPNVVRVVVGTQTSPTERVVLLEANVDDLDPRLWPGVLAGLMSDGALDAWLTPIVMKKGRPAHTLAVLAAPDRADHLMARVFALVPTLGVRRSTLDRAALERTWRTVEVDGVPVRVKIGTRAGAIASVTPEFDDVARAARDLGEPERSVLARTIASADAAGYRVGRALE
ncbi:nickel pincer cofactor biosynthesis protein LarC [Isoptericola sp. b490]|uniref:nickel pincer cofactor biosynthesis protein LarC n=1 Tax=Actinotalea lenta TaxID=3064654 RepID=UPI002712AB97|nr:nickel pincer cofactor biosynthesis protein LarC [Isoptericola sp. b490]MDO8120325.1 nickel pincer cofactor biosynthesis protein LarC [Isoptericola sp. b490]